MPGNTLVALSAVLVVLAFHHPERDRKS